MPFKLFSFEVTVSPSPDVDRNLQAILRQLSLLSERTDIMATALENITREVAETRTVIGSATVLLGQLKVALDEAIADGSTEALEALSADLDAQQAALAAAVAANTPTPVTPPAPPADPVV